MRIIAGLYRGRKIESPKTIAIRPTTDKIRGAIFNALTSHIDMRGICVLDAFCGTGALGLEAISRGAAQGILIDTDRDALELARQNAQKLGADTMCKFIRSNAQDLSAKPVDQPAADLAFLDPPYNRNLITVTLNALHHTGWTHDHTLFVIESEHDALLPSGFTPNFDRIYGQSHIRMGYFTSFGKP
jgi:16S rRNA (guanine966-N2)-methyltransferase